MLGLKKKYLWVGAVVAVFLLVITAGIAGVAWSRSRGDPGDGDPPAGSHDRLGDRPRVTAIQARKDANFSISASAPAYVEPYLRASLEAQETGPIKPNGLIKDIGAAVKAGEVLVEIDRPDLVEDVKEKEALVEKAKKDLELAEAGVPVAESALKSAQKEVEEKRSEIKTARATMELKRLTEQRINTLVTKDAVYRQIDDESKRDYEAAQAAYESAQIAVEKALSDVTLFEGKLQLARVDIKYKTALVHVAEGTLAKARALAGYTQTVAPWDGVIVDRKVNPGSFVQVGTHMLTLERQDIVTVYMMLPDSFAPYVSTSTEALLELSDLPGEVLHATVTRFSPSVDKADRRMRVEVDLYNRSAEEFKRFLAQEQKTGNADLKDHLLPVFPRVEAKDGASDLHPLIAGTYGTMRLQLQKFKDVYLIPSSAIYREAGVPYIFEVIEGKVHKLRVEDQADDGDLAKVVVLRTQGSEMVKKPLTGREVIVRDHQAELTDGQPVDANVTDWRPDLGQ